MAVVSVVLGLTVIAAVAIGILKLVDWLTLKGWRKNDDGSAWRARLHHPDFPSLEKHFGCKVPESLKRLYGDHVELERGNFTLIAQLTNRTIKGAILSDPMSRRTWRL